MNRKRSVWKLMGMAILPVLALVLAGGRPVLAAQDKWPKRFQHPKGAVVMYQPQLEDFKDDKLTARAAVSVQTKGMKAPLFGAVWLSGRVLTDRDTRMATIDQVKVTEAKFPDAKPEQVEKLKTFLNTEMADLSLPISLDRLLAALEVVEKEQAGDRGLNNDPPRIIFVSHPAVLVPLDGDPKLLPLPKSSLMRVANTPFLMLYDTGAKTYYLKGGEAWLAAGDLQGPWRDVDQIPEAIRTLEAAAQKAAPGQGAPKKVEAKAGKMPEIIVSTVPAELLATAGEPQYTPIKDTNLLYLSNTESNIFMDTASQDYYALISGRWFKTKSLAEGPWTYAAPAQLPPDFAKIPENSVKGLVLVSVAGTPQAKEAVLENSIPQTAVIDRKKATTKVEYAGEPQFEKIADTNLEYAVNTGAAVFKEGTKYYAVDQGVWYEADSPNGPWTVSANPPTEVNKIPPSNPRYNAKYVKVYDSTEDTVTVGYTPGYTGSYVDNGTVAYGTGYSYAGYSSPEAYIPPPATYGYAAAYNPYAGTWGYQTPYYNPASWLVPGLMGFAAGMAVGAVTSPWWGHGPYYGGGGWWGAGGYNNVNINNIHNNVINRRPDHRPNGRPIHHPVVSPHNNLYNRPGNENRLASRPGQPGARPGSGAGPSRPGQGPGERPSARPGGPSQAGGSRPATRPAQAAKPRPSQPQVRPAGGKNNVLADRSGNVYKRDHQGNYQQRQGGQWQPATASATRPGASTRPTPSARPAAASQPSFNRNQMNRDFAARQRGDMRTQNFQRASAASRPSHSFSRPSGGGRPSGSVSRPSGGGGGGARGGGGGGRGGGGGGGGGGGRRR
ncbi:MAG: hypothetical protein AB1424_17715 [Thermodesulfobacteriota bacterium]